MFTFVEAPLFTKLVGRYPTDRDYAALRTALSDNPQLGDLIPGTGGVRKVRWKALDAGSAVACA